MIVITPKALAASGYKPCNLGKLKEQDSEEAFLYIFPSPDPINAANGDGELYEIHDFDKDYSWVLTERGQHKRLRGEPITAETTVYFRGAYAKAPPLPTPKGLSPDTIIKLREGLASLSQINGGDPHDSDKYIIEQAAEKAAGLLALLPNIQQVPSAASARMSAMFKPPEPITPLYSVVTTGALDFGFVGPGMEGAKSLECRMPALWCRDQFCAMLEGAYVAGTKVAAEFAGAGAAMEFLGNLCPGNTALVRLTRIHDEINVETVRSFKNVAGLEIVIESAGKSLPRLTQELGKDPQPYEEVSAYTLLQGHNDLDLDSSNYFVRMRTDWFPVGSVQRSNDLGRIRAWSPDRLKHYWLRDDEYQLCRWLES